MSLVSSKMGDHLINNNSLAFFNALISCVIFSLSFAFSPGGTMGYLVWGMFGMGESNAPDLKKHGAPLHSIINNMDAKKKTIVIFGYLLYGTFIFASTIVLMNLLIAVMANTFQEIQVS